VDIGPYTFVASANYTADKYMLTNERDHLVAFMMAKDGKITGNDPEKVRFMPGLKGFFPEMHRHVTKEYGYQYVDGSKRYMLTLKQKDVLRIKSLLAIVVDNRFAAAIADKFIIGGPVLRATYDAWLEVQENGQPTEKYGPDDCKGQVVGEIFYPGKDDPADYPQYSR
jgi:hypothetical protein